MTSETLIETAAAKATRLLAAANPVPPVAAPPASAAPPIREPKPDRKKNTAPDPVTVEDTEKRAQAQPAPEKSAPPPQKKSNDSRRRESSNRRHGPPLHSTALQNVVNRFAACDRCSYFMAGYRSIHGNDNLETAVNQVDDNRLNLTWSVRTSKLVQECYGVRVDLDYFHYEGCCVSCQRHFVYWQETDAEEKTVELFSIAL